MVRVSCFLCKEVAPAHNLLTYFYIHSIKIDTLCVSLCLPLPSFISIGAFSIFNLPIIYFNQCYCCFSGHLLGKGKSGGETSLSSFRNSPSVYTRALNYRVVVSCPINVAKYTQHRW